MSVSSFPRPEHVALLRRKIEERVRERNLPLEVAERGLNQWKCQYRFGLRQVPSSPVKVPEGEGPPSFSAAPQGPSAEGWMELAIHFQIAQRLEEGQGTAEFDSLLDHFLSRFRNSGGGAPTG